MERRRDSTSSLSQPDTPPPSRRFVSFYPTSAGSTALWPDDLPIGTDALTYPQGHPNQQLGSVTGLHAWIIEARSPLIAAAFESSVSGKRLHLDSLDPGTVLPFVRFLYTGYYASHGDWEDVPTSVSLHCRMYYLGHIYDLADLKSQAYVNVLRQCEFGCSSPNMPIDLCPAIDFVYRHLPGHDAISDALVQYCVTRCLSHKLHENAEFRKVAFFVRAFHQDLTKACRDRDYEDDSAAIIIQLPYMHYAPATYASTEDPPISRFEDVVHHYHSTDRFDDVSPKKRQRAAFDERQTSPTKAPKLQESTEEPVNGLALRQAPKKSASVTFEAQSTPEREAKLPELLDAPRWQLGTPQKPHQQQPQMIVLGRQEAASSSDIYQIARKVMEGFTEDEKARVRHDALRDMQQIHQEAAPVRPTSASDIYQSARKVMESFTEDEKVRVRRDVLRNMSEQQLHQASARKQDALWLFIHEQVEQADEAAGSQQPIMPQYLNVYQIASLTEEEGSQWQNDIERQRDESRNRRDSHEQYIFQRVRDVVMNLKTSTPATSSQQQNRGLPLRPVLEAPIPAATQTKTKLPIRSHLPSSTDVLDMDSPLKDQDSSIWKRRGMVGPNSGLSQAFRTMQNQEKESQGDQSIEAAALQKHGDSAVSKGKKKIQRRKVIDTEFNPTFHSLQSVQGSISCKVVVQEKRASSLQGDPSAKSTRDHPSKIYPEVTTPSASVAPSAPSMVSGGPIVQINAGPNSGNHALQDYQMQLMLLEQQNKMRLLMARQEQDSITNPPGHTSTNMQPAVPTAVSKLSNETLEERYLRTMPRDVRIRKSPAATNASGAVEVAGEPNAVGRACARNQPPVPHPSERMNHALVDYHAQLRLLDEQNAKRAQMLRGGQESFLPRTNIVVQTAASSQPPVTEPGEAQRTYYQTQLMLLEQQNKKRLRMQRQEEDESRERASASNQPPVPELGENQSTKIQWPDLGKANANADFDFDSFLDSPSPVPPRVEPQPALSDAQVQALLLGQKEKKRLVMARLEEDEEAERLEQAASARRQGGFTFPCHTEGDNDVLANFDFDAFLDTNVMESSGHFDNFDFGGEIASPSPHPSSTDDQDRDAPVPQPNEARTLESYQAQLAYIEEDNRRLCNLRSASDSRSAAPRATSPPAAPAAPTSDRRQGGLTPACQTECGNEMLEAFAAQYVSVESGGSDRDNDPFESDSGSDSDAQSWVDVAMEPTSGSGGVSPAAGTATARHTVPASPQRSPSHSDSEWEIC
jgi:hypothetical protein